MRFAPRPFLAWIAVATASSWANNAHAVDAPPIKPGLWELQVEREGGPAIPDMSAKWKNMPPEQRKQIEAMMKKHGVGLSGSPNNVKLCLDKASLDKGNWQGQQNATPNCKTDTTQSGKTWKWHTVCGAPHNIVSDGEATVTNPESYVVKAKTTSNIQGQPQTTQNTIKSKWLSADCGDIKPIQSLQQPPSGLPGQPKRPGP